MSANNDWIKESLVEMDLVLGGPIDSEGEDEAIEAEEASMEESESVDDDDDNDEGGLEYEDLETTTGEASPSDDLEVVDSIEMPEQVETMATEGSAAGSNSPRSRSSSLPLADGIEGLIARIHALSRKRSRMNVPSVHQMPEPSAAPFNSVNNNPEHSHIHSHHPQTNSHNLAESHQPMSEDTAASDAAWTLVKMSAADHQQKDTGTMAREEGPSLPENAGEFVNASHAQLVKLAELATEGELPATYMNVVLSQRVTGKRTYKEVARKLRNLLENGSDPAEMLTIVNQANRRRLLTQDLQVSDAEGSKRPR